MRLAAIKGCEVGGLFFFFYARDLRSGGSVLTPQRPEGECLVLDVMHSANPACLDFSASSVMRASTSIFSHLVMGIFDYGEGHEVRCREF